jgi:beta-1,4-N-acetylglucosaminyltransferase
MAEHTNPTLLVTVGSTLFPRLTDAILSTPILEILSERISVLRVQLGRATIPPHLQEIVSDFQAGPVKDSCRGRLGKMEVEILRYTDDFEDLVKRSFLMLVCPSSRVS